MSDERREAAEAYANGIGARLNRLGNVVLAHMAGDEAGARREREEERRAVVAFLLLHPEWSPRLLASFIQRNEHRGGE